MSELRSVRLIHGYGTGQLRRAIAGYLQTLPVRGEFQSRAARAGRRRRDRGGAEGIDGRSFPQSFIEDLKSHAEHRADRAGARAAAAGRRRVEGAVPVSRREDAVVQRERGAADVQVLRLRRRRRRHQVHRAATTRSRFRKRSGSWRPGRADRCRSRRSRRKRPQSQRDREALLKAHEVAAAFFREQLQAPAGARGPPSARAAAADAGDDRAPGHGLRAADRQRPARSG